MEKPNLKGLYEKIHEKMQSDKKLKTIAISGLCLFIVLAAVMFVYSRSVLEVSVNGQTIGYVKNHEKFLEIKKGLKARFKDKLSADVQFVQEIKATPVRAFGHKLDLEDDIIEKLEKTLTCKLKAVAINIDGKEVAMVKDKATAEKVLDQVKQHYISQTPGELIKLEVAEKVKLVERYVYAKDIISAEAAVDLILKGGVETRTYEVVEGDSLWTISRRENIPLEELIKANPQLKSEHELAIGDIINLTEVKPLLNVSILKKVTYEESIPFETETIKDNSMWTWDQKVKQEGQKGVKEVTAEVLFANGIKVSEQVIGEKVIKEPVKRIVAKGTKAEVAFRGNGRFAWPVVGTITSPYGYRGREFHSGIDIAQSKGAPVRASNSGTVTFAGWRGGYGNLVIINHGGGIETYYAHNSAITVSVGQKVEKGQQIAKVGSTGRSTGNHVHFEIRINGSPVNPLNYL
ncbi:MAG TPA: peptidoglycan DD-metalloendopeptidase family protein [Thermoanaerobacterales bacterium]|nr:peptidoglycan DD-metalloendopeptidase family protein [Thermoanaerobacterales bacterium]